MRRSLLIVGLASVLASPTGRVAGADEKSGQPPPQAASPVFRVGFARRDITPTEPVPMWGYGARHDALSEGVMDPLYAKAIVVDVGNDKLAMVGLDLGRGPTTAMMGQIRQAIAERAGIHHLLISGSHTHHGPVIELTDRQRDGKGKFDAAISYAAKLPGMLTEVIVQAADNAQPAGMGVASTKLQQYNRNRHTRRSPKPTDPTLTVARFDDTQGKPIAVLVNFAAHPTMLPAEVLKFSADYPGHMARRVEETLATNCAFIQGAAGDLSVNTEGVRNGPKEFGEALGDRVTELAQSIETSKPAKPSLSGKVDHFRFQSRVDLKNPMIRMIYAKAFFRELTDVFFGRWLEGIPCEMQTVLLNKELAIVGVPGEFFCNHANRLRQRAYVDHVLFFGYCNGHCLYFPTIEATSEGGYGAAAGVSLVELGAGERMMDRALIGIYTMLGKYGSTPIASPKDP